VTYLICLICFTLLFYYCGKNKYDNPKKKEAFIKLIEYLQLTREKLRIQNEKEK